MKTVSFSRTLRVALLLGAAWGPALPLPARSLASSPDAKITHQTKPGEISVEHHGRHKLYKNGDSIPLRARHREDVNLIITDPNTLIFSYQLGERTEANTADYEALKKFAEALQGIFPKPAPPPGAAVAMAAKPPSEDLTAGGVTVNTTEIIEAAGNLKQQAAKIPGAIRSSLTRQLTEADFDPVEADESIKQVAKLQAFFAEVELAMLTPDDQLIKAGPRGGPSSLLSATQFWGKYKDLRSVFDVRERLGKVLATARAFVADYRAYQKALKGPYIVGTVVADNQKDITQQVVIAGNPAHAADGDVKVYQGDYAGTYSFVISPLQSFHYRIGAGMIYSFVRNPEYSVATDAAGGLTITEKSADYNEVSGAVALNIYPDRYFDEGVKWFGQLGVSPAKDANAFLAGAGFTAFEKFTFAAGLIYQQRRELGGGQTVGQALPKAEDLSVRHKFATGLYLQVGMAF